MKLPNTAFFRFIKQYPRISSLGAFILLLILLLMPISFKEKLRVIFVSVVLGFLIAVGIYYLRAKKQL